MNSDKACISFSSYVAIDTWMNLLQQFTHIRSVIVNSSQVRDGVAPVPIGYGSTVKAFVLSEFPLMLRVLNQPSPSLQPWNKLVRCVCVEELLVFILVAAFFWSLCFAERVFQKNPFPLWANCGWYRLVGNQWGLWQSGELHRKA